MKICNNSCLPSTSSSFVTSDLALRNCLLSASVTVKIGDYGLSHTKYKVCLSDMYAHTQKVNRYCNIEANNRRTVCFV